MIKRQYKASFLREWREITRTHKMTVYVAMAVGYLLVNLLLSYVGFYSYNTLKGIEISANTRYGFITNFNTFAVGIFLVVALILIRSSVTGELKEKKMVLPISMGLKPYVNITAKYIVQILTPSLIIFIMSVANGLISLALFSDATFISQSIGKINIDASVVFRSAGCVFAIVMFYLVIQFSLSALLRNCNIALIITLAVLVFGDLLVGKTNIATFLPNTLYNYSTMLYVSATSAQFLFSTLITVAIIALFAVASVMVYNDRGDLAI